MIKQAKTSKYLHLSANLQVIYTVETPNTYATLSPNCIQTQKETLNVLVQQLS